VKPRKCRQKAPGCHGEYTPWTGHIQRQGVCQNPACLLKKAEANRKKKEAKERSKSAREKREAKEASLTMRARQKRARDKAQEFARLRDLADFAERGERPKCIMCGRENPASWHGCHFVAVGSKGGPKSFHPANINLGCGQCNFYKDQSQTEYRENMIKKYGLKVVLYLENEPLDYDLSVQDVEEIRAYYREETKRMRKS